MNKKLIFVALLMAFLACGCTSTVMQRMIDKTNNYVANGEFEEALNYGKIALNEGCKSEKFADLVELIEDYIEAKTALHNNDLEEAADCIEDLEDFEGSGMTAAIKILKEQFELKLAERKSAEEPPVMRSPKAMLTEEEAIEVARKALDFPANAKVKVKLVLDYYEMNIETDYGDHTDELYCKVDALTGEVYDMIG